MGGYGDPALSALAEAAADLRQNGRRAWPSSPLSANCGTHALQWQDQGPALPICFGIEDAETPHRGPAGVVALAVGETSYEDSPRNSSPFLSMTAAATSSAVLGEK